MAAIRKQESGISTKEVAREMGVREATFYACKAKYRLVDLFGGELA